MSRAGKKDVLAAGGHRMVIAGGIGESPMLRKIAKGKGKKEEVRVDPVITVTKKAEPKLRFIPKNGCLLVRRDPDNVMSDIIQLADSVEKEQNNTGIVLASNVVDIAVGTRVVFGKYAGTEYRLNGEVLLIMRDEDVQGLLVLDEEEEVYDEVFPGLENTSFSVKRVTKQVATA